MEEIAVKAKAGAIKTSEIRSKAIELQNGISLMSMRDESLNNFIDSCLCFIGAELNISRLDIYEYNEAEVLLKNTLGWTIKSDGIKEKILNEIEISPDEWWINKLHKNELILYNDIRVMDVFSACEYLFQYKNKATLIAPIFANQKFWGFIGLHQYDRCRDWAYEAIDCLLLGVAIIIGQAIMRNEAEKGLSKEQLRITLLSIGDGVITTDVNGKVAMMNKTAEKLTGWSETEAQGTPVAQVFNIVDKVTKRPCENPVDNVLKTGRVSALWNNMVLISKKSEEYDIDNRAAPIKYKNSKIIGTVLVFRDVTEKKKREKEIAYLTKHDILTGLYSRAYLEKEMLSKANKNKIPTSIIVGDINGLKLINDMYGYEKADFILKNISKIILKVCKNNGLAARWGGDGFAALLPNISENTASKICKSIQGKCVQAAKREGISLSISLGYATKKSVDEDIFEVLRHAENFLYKIKLLDDNSLRNCVIKTMIKTLSEKSHETELHTERVWQYCKWLGHEMKLSENEMNDLHLLSILHDIGKIGINDNILNKPDRLTENEWAEMKRHSEIGFRIVHSIPELMKIAEYILYHHERWDGLGYPKRLKRQEIPLLSRIVAIADTYDAMIEDRVYRKGMTPSAAKYEIVKNAGIQFDPEITALFIKCIKEKGVIGSYL